MVQVFRLLFSFNFYFTLSLPLCLSASPSLLVAVVVLVVVGLGSYLSLLADSVRALLVWPLVALWVQPSALLCVLRPSLALLLVWALASDPFRCKMLPCLTIFRLGLPSLLVSRLGRFLVLAHLLLVLVALLRGFLVLVVARRVGVGLSFVEFWAGLRLGFLASRLHCLPPEIGPLGLGFVNKGQHKPHHQTVMALMPVPILVPVMRRHPLNLGGQGAFVYLMDSPEAHP